MWEVSGKGWINRHKKQPPNPKSPFCFCCFNNNGTQFAAAAYNTVQVWDFNTGLCLATLIGNLNVYRFCFSPDDTHLFSISDNIVTEWDIKSGQEFVISTGPRKDYVLCSICLNERCVVIR